MFIDVAQIHLDLMKYSMYRYELGSWNIYDVRLVHFATTNVNFSRVFFSGRGKEGGGAGMQTKICTVFPKEGLAYI